MLVYGSLLRAPVGNFIAQPCENENLCIESLTKFLRGNKTGLYFASKFSKSRRSQRSKLLAVSLKIFGRCIQKKQTPKSTQKANASQLSKAKMYKIRQ